MRAYIGIITLLLFWQTMGGHMRLAWWTTVYPQSLYETGIVGETDADAQTWKAENGAAAEKDEACAQTEETESCPQEDPIQIKWKLAEWIGHLFDEGVQRR